MRIRTWTLCKTWAAYSSSLVIADRTLCEPRHGNLSRSIWSWKNGADTEINILEILERSWDG